MMTHISLSRIDTNKRLINICASPTRMTYTYVINYNIYACVCDVVVVLTVVIVIGYLIIITYVLVIVMVMVIV